MERDDAGHKVRKVQLGFTEGGFSEGTHMCLIYRDERERKRIISRYIDSGLLEGERVGYFVDRMSPEEVVGWLKEQGVEMGGHESSLSVSPAGDVYCPDGSFVPERMLQRLRDYYRESLEGGFPGGRVSGEMDWALRGLPGSGRLIEYEAMVNIVVRTHPVTAICQYDANRFDGKTIMEVLEVHPMMIVNGQVVHNPYYRAPEEFLPDWIPGKEG